MMGRPQKLIILLLTVLVTVPIATTARSAESVASRLRSGHLTGPSARSIEVNCKELSSLQRSMRDLSLSKFHFF